MTIFKIFPEFFLKRERKRGSGRESKKKRRRGRERRRNGGRERGERETST